jgi:hypothetical protein
MSFYSGNLMRTSCRLFVAHPPRRHGQSRLRSSFMLLFTSSGQNATAVCTVNAGFHDFAAPDYERDVLHHGNLS